MQTSQNPLMEIALRIREMREIMGLTEAEMAEKTQVSPETYAAYETGAVDLPLRSFTNAPWPSALRLPTCWRDTARTFPVTP